MRSIPANRASRNRGASEEGGEDAKFFLFYHTRSRQDARKNRD